MFTTRESKSLWNFQKYFFDRENTKEEHDFRTLLAKFNLAQVLWQIIPEKCDFFKDWHKSRLNSLLETCDI